MNYILGLQEKVKKEKDRADLLEKLLKAIVGERYKTLTLPEATEIGKQLK
jgi:hypothetical protein